MAKLILGMAGSLAFSASLPGAAEILSWNWREWEGEASVAQRYTITVTVRN